jgi:hypothetical protein
VRKAVVAGVLGFGLLAGCEQQGAGQARALGEARFVCENTHGVKDNTPEMDECMLEIVPQSQRRDYSVTNETNSLAALRATCLNRYGHFPDTPELAQCVQQLDSENKRHRREGMQALGQALSSMAPSTTTCNTTYGGGYARTNCY